MGTVCAATPTPNATASSRQPSSRRRLSPASTAPYVTTATPCAATATVCPYAADRHCVHSARAAADALQ